MEVWLDLPLVVSPAFVPWRVTFQTMDLASSFTDRMWESMISEGLVPSIVVVVSPVERAVAVLSRHLRT